MNTTNKTREIVILSIAPNSNITTIHLDMFNAVSDKINLKQVFLLAYEDRKMEIILSDQNLLTLSFGQELKETERLIRRFNIPFLRMLLAEIAYYKIFNKVLSNLGLNRIDLIFINDKSNTVSKYFVRYAKRKYKTKSFIYVYGIGLRNPLYKKKLLKEDWRSGRHNVLIDIFRYIEQKMHLKICQLFGLLEKKQFSRFNQYWDYLLVKTNIDREMWLTSDFPEHKIRVVGSVWDYKIDLIKKRLLGSRVDSNDRIREVLILLQPIYELEEKKNKDQITFFENLDKLLESLTTETQKSWKINVKFHPRDEINRFIPLMEKYGNNVNWIKHLETDTLELVLNSDLIIVQSSTVILDAVNMERKLLFYKFSEIEHPFFDFPDLFEPFLEYDLKKNLDDNIVRAKLMKVKNEEIESRVEEIDLKEKFAEFLISCLEDS